MPRETTAAPFLRQRDRGRGVFAEAPFCVRNNAASSGRGVTRSEPLCMPCRARVTPGYRETPGPRVQHPSFGLNARLQNCSEGRRMCTPHPHSPRSVSLMFSVVQLRCSGSLGPSGRGTCPCVLFRPLTLCAGRAQARDQRRGGQHVMLRRGGGGGGGSLPGSQKGCFWSPSLLRLKAAPGTPKQR